MVDFNSIINKPVCRNWQTRQTQNLLSARVCGFESHHRHQTLTARKPLIYRGLRAFLYALLRLCNAPPTTENSPFCSSFSGGTLEGHCDYLEGYTPKIALADATFEAKFKCV